MNEFLQVSWPKLPYTLASRRRRVNVLFEKKRFCPPLTPTRCSDTFYRNSTSARYFEVRRRFVIKWSHNTITLDKILQAVRLLQKTECRMGLIDLANLHESDKVLITRRQSAVSTCRCWHFLQESGVLLCLAPTVIGNDSWIIYKKVKPTLTYIVDDPPYAHAFFSDLN